MKKETKSNNLKFRTTPSRKNAVETTAKSLNISTSSLLDEIIFGSHNSYAYSTLVQRNLIKNEMLNRIQSMAIPNKIKIQIFEELTNNE